MAVRLRDITDADLPGLFEQQRDERSVAMAGVPARDPDAFHAHWARIRADPQFMLKVIDLDGENAGHAMSFTSSSGRRVVGYWIVRERWGQGLATRALELLLEIEATRPLYAQVVPDNAASIRVLEKCGFTRTDEGADLTLVLRA